MFDRQRCSRPLFFWGGVWSRSEFLSIFQTISFQGLDLSKGVLLYGSSGCSKTLLAKAFSQETKCNFIEINCSDIFIIVLIYNQLF